MTTEFKLGDRVEVSDVEEFDFLTTFTGIICIIDLDNGPAWIGVRFDNPILDGHSCDGNCEYGYGYYVHPIDLTHSNKILNIKTWLKKQDSCENLK